MAGTPLVDRGPSWKWLSWYLGIVCIAREGFNFLGSEQRKVMGEQGLGLGQTRVGTHCRAAH